MITATTPRVPMSSLILARFGIDQGLTEEQVLAGSGLTLEGLKRPEATCTTTAELQVMRNLTNAPRATPLWGLEAGLRYHSTTFGVWGFALLTSPTMRDAIDVGLRFIDLTSAFTQPYAVFEGDSLGLVFGDPDEPEALARFIVLRELTFVQTVVEEIVGRGTRFQRVAFTHVPEPGTEDRYREIFGFDPEFGAERNLLLFDPELLDRALPQADEHTTALAQAQCREMLDRRVARTGLASQVRDLILSRLPVLPSATDVAVALNLSERTLRRRLSDEATSLRGLVDEVRAGLAAEFLESGSLTVAEIAQRLGYVELSSFSQAFRRWHGLSPRAYAAGHRS